MQTKRAIQKFKRLYFQEFGEELADEQAEKRAGYLLELYRIVFGLPSVEEFFDNKINEKSE